MQLFCERLRLRRERQGLTQEELAEKAKLSKRSIVKWERGPKLPTVRLAERLALALDTSVAFLLSGETKYPEHRPQHGEMRDPALIESTLDTLRSQAQSMVQQIDLLQNQIHQRPPRQSSSRPDGDAQDAGELSDGHHAGDRSA